MHSGTPYMSDMQLLDVELQPDHATCDFSSPHFAADENASLDWRKPQRHAEVAASPKSRRNCAWPLRLCHHCQTDPPDLEVPADLTQHFR